jgi:syndecan 4
MDPPKEMTVSYVTEDSVIISWLRPFAPFDYYKMSYQSARGRLRHVLFEKLLKGPMQPF